MAEHIVTGALDWDETYVEPPVGLYEIAAQTTGSSSSRQINLPVWAPSLPHTGSLPSVWGYARPDSTSSAKKYRRLYFTQNGAGTYSYSLALEFATHDDVVFTLPAGGADAFVVNLPDDALTSIVVTQL